MKKFIIILAVICYGNVLLAQDIIILKSGEEIKALVQEVGLNELKYKKFENPNGPVYTLQKTNVFMVRYENGEKDVFSTETTPAKTETQTKQTFDIGTTTLTTSVGSVFINDRKLSSQEVKDILSSNNTALKKYKSGISTAETGAAFAGAGLLAITAGLVFPKVIDKPVILIGLGGGSLVAGVVMILTGLNRVETAVSLYNSSIMDKPMTYNLKFGVTNSGGVGFTLKF